MYYSLLERGEGVNEKHLSAVRMDYVRAVYNHQYLVAAAIARASGPDLAREYLDQACPKTCPKK